MWQTQEALKRERAKEHRRELDERLRLYREGASLVKLAASRLKDVAAVLVMEVPVPAADRAQEALEAVTMHTDAMGRFPFEQLEPSAAQAFEVAFQGVLTGKSVVRSLIRAIDDRIEWHRDAGMPAPVLVKHMKDLTTCAEELNAIAANMAPVELHLTQQGFVVRDQARAQAA